MFERHAPMKPEHARTLPHVLFFAAVPNDTLKNQIALVWRSIGTGDRFRRDTLHMTIQAVAALHETPLSMLDRLHQAAASLRIAPITLCFDRLMTFGGRHDSHALVLATDGQCNCVTNLAAELHHAMTARGLLPPQRRKVVPHLTLAYGLGFSETRYLAEPLHWTIRDITLIDSFQGQGRHVSLGNWPLLDRRQQPSFDF